MFQVKISVGEMFEEVFYFNELPSSRDVVKALNEDKVICNNESSPEYDLAIEGAYSFVWPETWEYQMASQGRPIMFPRHKGNIENWRRDFYKVYIYITKCRVRKVDK